MKMSLRTLFKPLAALSLLLIILWLGGLFKKAGIAPEVLARQVNSVELENSARVERVQQPVFYRAVGSVESKVVVTISARVSGQVLSLAAKIGDVVQIGQDLAQIDSRDSAARVEQARSGLLSAEAHERQLAGELVRTLNLMQQEAATLVQLERAEAQATSAKAQVAAAKEALAEAEVVLSYGRVQSPLQGLVATRPVEPGDLAWPGKTLYTLHDPSSLRVAVWVREGAMDWVKIGSQHRMQVPSMELELPCTIDEILPEVDARSHSFLVRASLPQDTGLRPGMFARLLIEEGRREVIEVPKHAIEQVGQLSMLWVREEERWIRRYVTLGPEQGDRVEVLSGLSGDETIGWDLKR